MATMNVSLPDKMKQWVEEQVQTGRYGNASDYVRDLVRRDQERAEAREKLQQMVDEALASGRVEMGREELLARMRARAKAAGLEPDIRFGSFWKRRIRRLYPPYIITLLLFLLPLLLALLASGLILLPSFLIFLSTLLAASTPALGVRKISRSQQGGGS